MANLTSKELTAIEDQLNWEDVLVKKYKSLASQCTDATIKSQMEEISQKHQNHYNRLTTFLQ
ncbi:MAG: spore coat protein [Oscillospiraceae bacterium]|nr:spore coat protein [Oscillospiraceae bacterium]